MRKFIKIIVVLGGIGLAVITLALLAIRIFLPEEKLRRYVEDQIRQKLNREARLGRVQLGLLGLSLHSFKLSEVPGFSSGTFVEVEQARLRWNLLPFAPRKMTLQVRQGAVYAGQRSARLKTTASEIVLTLWDFDVTRTQGRLTVGQVLNPVYSGRDFSVQWNLSGIDASLGRMKGTMQLSQGPGRVQNLGQLAASSRSARLALLPLIALQNVEKSGLVNLGLPDLSHLDIQKITGDYDFNGGTMTINTFKIDGPQLTLGALGTIQLASGRLFIDVTMHTPEPVLAGEMDLKMRVTGTLANPQTNLDSLKKKAFKATVKSLLENPDAQKKIEKSIKSLFH